MVAAARVHPGGDSVGGDRPQGLRARKDSRELHSRRIPGAGGQGSSGSARSGAWKMNPAVKLSVRLQPSGGPVAPQVRVDGGSLDGHNRVLILIHGYNNSFED